jgi:hypothetical protein
LGVYVRLKREERSGELELSTGCHARARSCDADVTTESVSGYRDMHEAMTQLVEEATKKAFDVEARLKRSEANLRIKDAELAEALVGCFLE